MLHWLTAAVTGGPKRLGVENGRLSGCPKSPNCALLEVGYGGTVVAVKTAVLDVLQRMERMTIETDEPTYIHATALSPLWGFVDDVEIYIDEANKQIQLRSAARLGYGDLGANRKRLERIVALLNERL